MCNGRQSCEVHRAYKQGFIVNLAVDLERRFNKLFDAGIDYNFYSMRPKSKYGDLNGTLRIRHQGPKACASFKL